MKEKNEASQFFKKFCLMIKIQFGACTKVIRSDNGVEFTSGLMQKFSEGQGIIHQTSGTDNPKENGPLERKSRHMLNVVKAFPF